MCQECGRIEGISFDPQPQISRSVIVIVGNSAERHRRQRFVRSRNMAH